MTTNACAVWEFRLSECNGSKEEIHEWLKKFTKKYVFQLEQGDTGYKHFQGSFSLVKKRRKPELLKLLTDQTKFEHLAPLTNVSVSGSDFNYFMKADTRIAGPWSDQDIERYVPRQYKDIILYPWQQDLIEISQVFDTRTINMVYDPSGNIGKTTVASICELFHNGIDLPPVNDMKELIQVACDICMAKDLRDPSPIIMDMPRAMDKSRLFGIYSAIEQIKKGKLYDMRYHYKEWWIDSPCIWVFSNIEPDLSLLSRDRWKIWRVQDLKLIPYIINIDGPDIQSS